jgi:hypothetical protein
MCVINAESCPLMLGYICICKVLNFEQLCTMKKLLKRKKYFIYNIIIKHFILCSQLLHVFDSSLGFIITIMIEREISANSTCHKIRQKTLPYQKPN